MPNEDTRFTNVFGDALALYAAQFATYGLPVITLGYLARTIGPNGLGRVAYGQLLGGYLILIIEYGFHFTLTREVVRFRSDREALSDLLAAVWGAKALLSIASLPILLALLLASGIRDWRWGGEIYFWALSQSLSLLWYFHGTRRIRLGAVIEAGSKLAAAILIVATIKGAADLLLVFTWQSIAAILALIVSSLLVYRHIRFRAITIRSIREVLEAGWPMFVQRGASTLYASAIALVLGLTCTPLMLGLFSGPDRIVRGVLSLLLPILFSVFPRVNAAIQHSFKQGMRVAKTGLAASALLGCCLTVGTYSLAPVLVRLVLGPSFMQAVPVLRVLALLPVLRGVTTALGLQWMIPFGRDRALAKIYLGAALAATVSCWFVVIHYGAVGAAWVTVLTEAVIGLAQFIAVRRLLSRLTYQEIPLPMRSPLALSTRKLFQSAP